MTNKVLSGPTLLLNASESPKHGAGSQAISPQINSTQTPANQVGEKAPHDWVLWVLVDIAGYLRNEKLHDAARMVDKAAEDLPVWIKGQEP